MARYINIGRMRARQENWYKVYQRKRITRNKPQAKKEESKCKRSTSRTLIATCKKRFSMLFPSRGEQAARLANRPSRLLMLRLARTQDLTGQHTGVFLILVQDRAVHDGMHDTFGRHDQTPAAAGQVGPHLTPLL